jgi:hypothetical protein
MKSIFTVAACSLVFPIFTPVYCAEEITYDELMTPPSPAFSLLGVSPSSIDRPATPKAFAVSLLSLTAEGKGDIPKNLAIDTAPYWWFSHPDLTFEKYYNPDHIGQSIVRTFSVSVGTADGDETVNNVTSKATTFGIGLRFNIFEGEANPGLAGAVQKLKEAQVKALEQIPDTGPVPADLALSIERQLKSAGQAVRDFDKQRVGFMLQYASAVTFRLPSAEDERREIDRFGAWLTPSYRYGGDSELLNQFTFLGVIRYLREFRAHDDFLDAGARIVWRSKQIPLALSGEYLYRAGLEEGSSQRYGAVIEYVVNDTWSLVASYGKAFKNDFVDGSDTIAIFGINFGFGKGPALKQPTL